MYSHLLSRSSSTTLGRVERPCWGKVSQDPREAGVLLLAHPRETSVGGPRTSLSRGARFTKTWVPSPPTLFLRCQGPPSSRPSSTLPLGARRSSTTDGVRGSGCGGSRWRVRTLYGLDSIGLPRHRRGRTTRGVVLGRPTRKTSRYPCFLSFPTRVTPTVSASTPRVPTPEGAWFGAGVVVGG